MEPKLRVLSGLLPAAAELPRADAVGHSSGSQGQQAGAGTSCHFTRLVREAEFSPKLQALL